MVETLKSKLRNFLFKGEYDAVVRQNASIAERTRALDTEVNQRVASTLSKMDPFEPVMREFKGIFGEEFEHPEDRLDEHSVLQLQSFGFTVADDPSFNFLCEWIMNSQGNETLLRAPVTTERTLYGRAQIASVLAFRKEVRRLAEGYRDRLQRGRNEDFDNTLSTE